MTENTLTFYCKAPCKNTFKAVPEAYKDDDPDQPLAPCPECMSLAGWAHWERNLGKAWKNATGPKTEAGKAASASNLDGYPTPEQTNITRLNAVKHGAYSKTASYFPAKPGKYDRCETCTIPHDECRANSVCISRSEIFLRHHVAQETDNPAILRDLMANNQAALQATLEDLFLSISKHGPILEAPKVVMDFKNGGSHVVTYEDDSGIEQTVTELTAHPAVKLALEIMNKNGMSMADLNMTPKSQGEAEALRGKLSGNSTDALAAAREMNQKMENLGSLLNRGNQNTAEDPVYLQYQDDEKSAE